MQFLGQKGFTARWEVAGDKTIFIRMLTCPYRQIAREHNEVCHLDMQIIKEMLNVDPVRLTCMANGDEYCTYRVSQSVELVMNP